MTALHMHAGRGALRRPRRYDPIEALDDAASWVLATLRTWGQRARERGELAALDDRALADIGLNRADAEFLANKPFWRE